MFFGDMFKRQKPRGLTWIPRHFDEREFDPLDDEQYAEMRRQTRIQFQQLRSSHSKRRGMNPFILLAFVFMIAAIIWAALRPESLDSVRDIQLSPQAVVEDDGPAAEVKPLYVEKDTVHTEAAQPQSGESR
ncbi:hypothetical protein KQI52_15345 [bacterium]|nr:hypothetical protein [bacterium]